MILQSMLDRLHAGLFNGPAMMTRCHKSRQRVDLLAVLKALGAPDAELLPTQLLTQGSITIPAAVPPFTVPVGSAPLSPEDRRKQEAWEAQEEMLDLLRLIRTEAHDYFQNHGEPCLAVGHPLVSIPPNAALPGRVQNSGRILAPLLFMPVTLEVGLRSITVKARNAEADGERHFANPALIAWLERLGDDAYEPLPDDHEDAGKWWKEAEHLLHWMQRALGVQGVFTVTPDGTTEAVPSTDHLGPGVRILPSAVLGLFPLSHHAVIQDTRWMIANPGVLTHPVTVFLDARALEARRDDVTVTDMKPETPVPGPSVNHFGECLVAEADPCQRKAVREARQAPVLVVHGPPGTGKSQTIANMIGDHLARGERVLFVCDKRTALDEVWQRLDTVGLSGLCGVVHDPSADRRGFFKKLRDERLLKVPFSEPPEDPTEDLASLNEQMNRAQEELERCRKLLHGQPPTGGVSFHELLGEWLGLVTRQDHQALPDTLELGMATLDRSRIQIEEVLQRAEQAGHGANPFLWHLALDLTGLMRQPGAAWLEELCRVREKANAADALAPESAPAFGPATSLSDQSSARQEAARFLATLRDCACTGLVRRLGQRPAEELETLQRELDAMVEWRNAMDQHPLRPEFVPMFASGPLPAIASVNQSITTLAAWDRASRSWILRWISGPKRKAAAEVLAPFGVGLEATSRALDFHRGLKARLLIVEFLKRTGATLTDADLWRDDVLHRAFTAVQATVALRLSITRKAAWTPLEPIVQDAFGDISALREAAPLCEASAVHAGALMSAHEAVAQTKLFATDHLSRLASRWGGGEPASHVAGVWVEYAATLEEVIRLQMAHAALPQELRAAVKLCVDAGAGMDCTWSSLRCHALAQALRARFKSDQALAGIDGTRIAAAFETMLVNARRKPSLVRDAILRRWLILQKSRLADPLHKELTPAGFALKERLFLHGRRSLKFRQMLEKGATAEGGDPIYDMCPVWMASPSTVAQIFPRQQIFDVIIFDEASQCRLEHALPALIRARRVVIAGDQKQMPPTNFFRVGRSTVAVTGDEDDDDQAQFAWQQVEAEDLLTAALNLRVREAHLDIHYRSRNSVLIGFSNDHFYQSRLQPIPWHPRNRLKEPPIQLHHVGGVYAKQTNQTEAAAVADKVAELLADGDAPSIGIASFNMPQRDAILKALEKRAAKDADFARRYRDAQGRKGRDDSFQGIFVKNLENLQGAERDVILISTTFGPDADGRFVQNFGALSQRGGERRLNVLVTRARHAVHVFTSIPKEKYQAADTGDGPRTGRHELYAYLRYAERTAGRIEGFLDRMEQLRRDEDATVTIGETDVPSRSAQGLASALLAQHGIGSTVHWGTDGFGVDVACTHPELPADVTIGILTDFSRYPKTDDPIAWDVFRTTLLEGQGWELHRIWTPQILWRHREHLEALALAHAEHSQAEALAAAD